jgi:HSP20 family protein
MNLSLTKRKNNLSSIDSFRKNIDSLFDDFFSLKPTNLFDSEWLPSIDVEESDNKINIKAEVPGIDEKDINVTLENNILTIAGEKAEEKKEENKKKNYIFSERRFGSFCRSVTLPEGIKADKIKAKFTKGILDIEIPKDEKAQPKRIQIDVN